MNEYNPLNHSVVQACFGSWSRYQCDDFVEALFDKILEEIKRVHWNVYQHQWGPSWHADEVEDPMIDGISFARFYQDRCDCGGMRPACKPDCRSVAEHHEWNSARLEWAKAPDQDPAYFGALIDMAKLVSGDYPVPHPPCTCGAAVNWEEHECAPDCIGQRPNFQFEDVEIRWYKYPGRGMSTNKDWTSDEWRAWFDRCLKTIRDFEGDLHSEDGHQRSERLRQSLRERFPHAFQ